MDLFLPFHHLFPLSKDKIHLVIEQCVLENIIFWIVFLKWSSYKSQTHTAHPDMQHSSLEGATVFFKFASCSWKVGIDSLLKSFLSSKKYFVFSFSSIAFDSKKVSPLLAMEVFVLSIRTSRSKYKSVWFSFRIDSKIKINWIRLYFRLP